MKSGDEEQLELLFGSVPGTLSELIRTAFIPRDGCRFIVADFSAIEARVLAWLAGEEWVLDEFRGKGKIYEATASRMFHIPQETIVKGHPNYEYRQKGKQATLSCIAEGQLVLTDQGLVPIEQIQLHHKVWDGESWVAHEGLVYRGRREVITYEGLTATADHLVWVEGKSRPVQLGFAAACGAHLVQTGNGGQAVRLGEDHQLGKTVEREMESLLCAYGMLLMPFDSMDDPVQSDTGNLAGMSELLGEAKANPYVAGSTADGSQSSLREPKRQELSIIWRTGNQVLLSIGHQGGNLDFGECARCMPGERNGSNRQQWALRTGEYQICSKEEESGQSRIDGAVGMGSAVLAVLSKCSGKNVVCGKDSRGNHRISTGSRSFEAEKLANHQRTARLYDLRNAGPHHRFTVSGKLVHNCGYGGGVGALKAMGAKMPEEEMQPLVDAWRAANPHIVQFWYALGNAASEVIEKRNSVRVGKVKVYWQENRMLIRLPGGRDLCYLSPRFVTNRFGSRGIGYLAAGASGKMELQETFGGKIAENCLAEGTLVITNCGLVPIECISASHLIWDGEAFVHHEGVLSKGIQATIFVDGIWMTPEHKILTGEGMVACEQSEGLNWASVQLPDGFEKRGKQQTRQTNVEMQMCLWERSCDSGILSQPKGQKISSAFLWLYEKQIDQQGEENARNEPPSSIRCLAFYETTMRRSKSSCVPQLWGTWNQGLRRMAAQLRNVLARYGANVQEGPGTGSDRQQQRVLRGKLPLGGAQNQCPEPQSDEDNRHPLWQNVGGGVMRTNEYWRDNDAVSIGSQVADRVSVCQARLPQFVYDIRNCGPRHRFAVWANGRARVVSNCTQAISRDLLAHAMINLEAAGYPIVFHVHDEAVMEVPIGQGSVEEACRIMAIPPDWARDLPLRADGEEMEFYRK